MAAHTHGPADPGQNAGVVVPFKGKLARPIKGSATVTAAQMADLEAAKYYVNIHAAANKGGEIRGQLQPAP
jgi:CHRD domain